METVVFVVCAVIVLGGALGVIISRNPVHAALSLVATLFGVAVLFIAQKAHLLAAVQVIVYTGAIVVLILFVLMLLGVDRAEDLETEPLVGQRILAVVVGVALLAVIGSVILLPVIDGDDASVEANVVTGARTVTEPLSTNEDGGGAGDEGVEGVDDSNIAKIGRVLFTDYVLAFELTAVLLTIAVVGAVVLSRRPTGYAPLPPDPVLGPGDGDGDGEDEPGGESPSDADEEVTG
jgi:NADH-quinone oxidoreductase subunit J